jgi:hypothetical protein
MLEFSSVCYISQENSLIVRSGRCLISTTAQYTNTPLFTTSQISWRERRTSIQSSLRPQWAFPIPLVPYLHQETKMSRTHEFQGRNLPHPAPQLGSAPEVITGPKPHQFSPGSHRYQFLPGGVEYDSPRMYMRKVHFAPGAMIGMCKASRLRYSTMPKCCAIASHQEAGSTQE